MRPNVGEHIFIIEAGVLVTPPSVYRIALRAEATGFDRSAKIKVGDTVMCTKLDDDLRFEHLDEPERERNVAVPCTGVSETIEFHGR
jgi:hypothetical protein